MTDYERQIQELEDKKCLICHGSGECDDAEPGDIYFFKFTCPQCGGTGVNNG